DAPVVPDRDEATADRTVRAGLRLEIPATELGGRRGEDGGGPASEEHPVAGAGRPFHALARQADPEHFIGALLILGWRKPIDAVLAPARFLRNGRVERRPAIVAGTEGTADHDKPPARALDRAETMCWTTTGRVSAA